LSLTTFGQQSEAYAPLIFNQAMTQQPPNPFIYGPMIRDAQKFFGRIAIRRQLLSRMQTMQHTSIVGERRIGKSSLLWRLHEEAKQAMPEITIVYSDLPDVADEASFYACVCRALNQPGTEFGFNELKRAVERKPAVLCLDEFETVCADQKFSVNFFNSLRSLAQAGERWTSYFRSALPVRVSYLKPVQIKV